MERDKVRQDNEASKTKNAGISTTNNVDGDDFTSSGVWRPFP